VAGIQAVEAVCEAVIELLKRSYSDSGIPDKLKFAVFTADDFSKNTENKIDRGVSLFLYRILPNGSHRTPSGRIGPDGRRYRTQLPVDLHFILTSWAPQASLQHFIAGWMMRTLEDNPILSSTLLNEKFSGLNEELLGVFRPDETVEVVLDDLSTEDLLHLWETLVAEKYHLSVPYVARNVRIESKQMVMTAGKPVQTRTFEYHEKRNGGT
jgi:hypothetical protein